MFARPSYVLISWPAAGGMDELAVVWTERMTVNSAMYSCDQGERARVEYEVSLGFDLAHEAGLVGMGPVELLNLGR